MSLSDFAIFFGGWSVASTAVIAYIFNRIADKLSIKWKETADANLSKLQGEIQKNNNAISSLLSMYGTTHQQAQERRIRAIETLWTNLSKFKKIIPSSVTGFIYSVLNDEEIKDLWTRATDDPGYNDMRSSLKYFDFTSQMKNYTEIVDIIEGERPFIGEKIWQQFEVYKMFLGRIFYLVQDGTRKSALKHWHNDEPLKDFFKRTLSDKEFEYIYSTHINSYTIASALLERKLLREIDRNLSGENFSESALEQAKKLELNLANNE